jgi:SAM-dependent methyltransferase
MIPCKLCGSLTVSVGSKRGKISTRQFHLVRCSQCQFAFVADPWTDYGAIYSEDYYRGLGVDPYVDYVFESDHPDTTIRTYEWSGILENIRELFPLGPQTRWLDFGCGQGGLLRYCSRHVQAHYFGFEQGWIPEGVVSEFTIIRQPEALQKLDQFDVITAIEVFEHIADPIETIAFIRTLLKKGGVLFFTTGNPQPHWHRFLAWEYVYPEIHIGYYTPMAIDGLLTRAGFRTEFRKFLPGYAGILRYKVLKRLGVKEQQFWERLLPWRPITKAIDRHLRASHYPIAWG